jgi:hypothetical protein
VVEDGVLLGEREAGERSVTGRGHCSAVEDGVLLGKREAGERSVTGRGPRIRLLSIATTKVRWVAVSVSTDRCPRLNLGEKAHLCVGSCLCGWVEERELGVHQIYFWTLEVHLRNDEYVCVPFHY